jgi:hypothetical protein
MKRNEIPFRWGWRNDKDAPGSITCGDIDRPVAVAMCPRYGKASWPADAEFIVTACNHHAELLAALVDLRSAEPLDDDDPVLLAARKRADAIIAKSRA